MSALVTLLKALPEIIALIKALQKAADAAEADRQVKADIKTIHEAFSANDPEKLRRLFAD